MTPLIRLLAASALALSALPLAAPAFANPAGCPPGLAKKNPPCVPPGQAKKWSPPQGALHHHGHIFYLDDHARYDLPPLPAGQRYAVIDNRIVVMDAQGHRILQLIRVFFP